MTGPTAPTKSRKPGSTLAKLLRAPARLYDWHAGWILGRRFLRLTHVDRRSGRHYHTMLEVIGENQTAYLRGNRDRRARPGSGIAIF